MNILIVGLGSIALKHVAALRELVPEAKIYALRSSNPSPAIEGVENIYEIDDKKEFDFAIISNPTSKHAEAIERLEDHEMPLFIEKPLFSELGKDDIIERIRERGILTYVACNLRFLDCLIFLRNYVLEHPQIAINEVNVYCGSYLPDWRPGIDYRKCYSAIPKLGGGVHLDLIHEIDYVYWIFGRPTASAGFCRSVSSLDLPSVDYANYLLFYPTFTASIILNYYRRDYRRSMEILFDDATWIVDISRNEIHTSDGGLIFKGRNTPIDTYRTQMDYFLKLLNNKGSKAENDVATAYEVLKICLNHERP